MSLLRLCRVIPPICRFPLLRAIFFTWFPPSCFSSPSHPSSSSSSSSSSHTSYPYSSSCRHLVSPPLPPLAPLSCHFPLLLAVSHSSSVFTPSLHRSSLSSLRPPAGFSPFVVITLFVFPSFRRPHSSSSPTPFLFADPSAPPPRPSSSPLTRLVNPPRQLFLSTLLILIDPRPPPHQLSLPTLLLPVESPPGSNLAPLLGTRCHWVRLTAVCCHCRFR